MRRTLLLLAALAIAVASPAFVTTASPEETGQKPSENAVTMSGILVFVSATEIIIKTADGDRRFSIDERTELPTDLGADARVKVTFRKLDDGRLHATRVTKAD